MTQQPTHDPGEPPSKYGLYLPLDPINDRSREILEQAAEWYGDASEQQGLTIERVGVTECGTETDGILRVR